MWSPRRTHWLSCLGPLLLAACEQPSASDWHFTTEDAGGLEIGANVYAHGVRVGKVKNVRVEAGRARVEFLLTADSGVQLLEGSCVRIGRYAEAAHVSVEPGSTGAPALSPGSEITCVKPPPSLDEVSERMNAVLDAALDKRGVLGKLLHDEQLANDVAEFFKRPPAPASPTSAASPSASVAVPAAPSAAPAPATKPQPKPAVNSELKNPF